MRVATGCILGCALLLCLFMLVTAVPKATDRLQIGVLKRVEVCERRAQNGDMLQMHYAGSLLDGTEFDSSYNRGEPFTFRLGQGSVIKGWDQGLLGMCVGEKRKLVIPPQLGYGDRGAGDKIPGGATLVFVTELMGIQE